MHGLDRVVRVGREGGLVRDDLRLCVRGRGLHRMFGPVLCVRVRVPVREVLHLGREVLLGALPELGRRAAAFGAGRAFRVPARLDQRAPAGLRRGRTCNLFSLSLSLFSLFSLGNPVQCCIGGTFWSVAWSMRRFFHLLAVGAEDLLAVRTVAPVVALRQRIEVLVLLREEVC